MQFAPITEVQRAMWKAYRDSPFHHTPRDLRPRSRRPIKAYFSLWPGGLRAETTLRFIADAPESPIDDTKEAPYE